MISDINFNLALQNEILEKNVSKKIILKTITAEKLRTYKITY